MENISLLVAFGAGLLSFFSPCILPLVPVYFATLCGPGVLDKEGRRTWFALAHSLCFVSGFSVLFTAFGAGAGLAGLTIGLDRGLANTLAGSALIIFGLFMLAAIKVPWLNFEKRLAPSMGQTAGYLRSFLIGGIFSLAWTPCVSYILGGILTLAWNSETAGKGALLLGAYSLGLGIPFIIIGLFFSSLVPWLKHVRGYATAAYVIGGLLLVGVGILTLTNKLTWFSSLA